MKRFWGFVVKEFLHIFRDYRTLLILFGMPAVQLILFGYVVTNEIKDARIAILDQSKDETTRKITEKITSSGYFMLDRNLNTYSEIGEAFKEGNIKLVIVFEPDFTRKLEKDRLAHVQLIGDASDPNTANILVNDITGDLPFAVSCCDIPCKPFICEQTPALRKSKSPVRRHDRLSCQLGVSR